MITVKEEFLGDEKTQRALQLGGCLAIVVWLGLKTYAAKNLTDGFVPEEAVDMIPGMPRGWRKGLQALLACGKLKPDGQRGPGLVDAVTHGYQLHDYLDHANSSDEERERKRKAREQKAARRAELRRQEEQRVRGQLPGHKTDSPRLLTDGKNDTDADTGSDSELPRADAPARASGPARVPSPTQPNPAEDPPIPPKGGVRRDRFLESLEPPNEQDLAVLEIWKRRFGKTGVSFDARRMECLGDRRLEGMSLQDASDAVDGAAADDWCSTTGFKLTVIFADRERFEAYRDAGRNIREGHARVVRSPRGPELRQPDSGYSPTANAKEIT